MNEQIAYDKKRNQKIHKHKYSRIAMRFKSKQEQKNDPLLFFVYNTYVETLGKYKYIGFNHAFQ